MNLRHCSVFSWPAATHDPSGMRRDAKKDQALHSVDEVLLWSFISLNFGGLLTFFVRVWYVTSAVVVAFSVYVHVYSLKLSGVI